MIYLDNAATTMPKAPGVVRAVQDAMLHCASIGRSSHAPAKMAADIAFRCRALAAKLFHTKADRIVFTMNATHGLNQAIFSVVKPGDRIVISGFEHNSVLRPLHALGADIHIAGRNLFDPNDTLQTFRYAMNTETKAVICTHVSNVFGYILPLEEIAAVCAEREVPLIVDASQSAGILPIDFQKLQAAFVAMPGHKGLYGPQGTGLLLCGELPNPLIFGGTGSLSKSMEMPVFLPDRMEAGTQNTPGIAGLLAGLEFLQEYGLEKIRMHEQGLMDRLWQNLKDVHKIRIWHAENSKQAGVMSFTINDLDCETVAEYLSDEGFAVRAGLHCAPIAHESAGTLESGTVRISVSAFNSAAEMDDFGACLQKIGNR